MASRLRLVDLLAGLSVASDLGMGLPPEEAMRSCLTATALARRMGRADNEVGEVLYTTLLLHVGCTAYAHEAAAAFGDEIAVNAASTRTNFLDPRDVLTTFIPAVTRDRGHRERARIAAYALARGSRFGERSTTAVCEVGRQAARRLGLPEAVQQSLYEIFEHWNGTGTPRGLEGEQSGVAARVARVASVAVVFAGLGGPQLAVEVLRRRAGGMLDPSIVEAFSAHAVDVLEEASTGDPRERILAAEPEPVAYRDAAELPELATVFADLADLKTPFTLGHSRAVGALAGGAAERLRLDPATAARARLAGLLHDLGRIAISTAIWEKPAALSAAEWEQVRLHPYHSERILAGSQALEDVASLAGMHHERLDGSGYHRGCKAPQIPLAARILATADAYQAMTEPRAHRAALDPTQAAQELAKASRAGLLDPDAVTAVLEASGQRLPRRRTDLRPAGLTEREIEVLRLIARGCSNHQIAERLVISRRTAEHHVQHIYAKLGSSSRPAAAVFALEHDLLT